MFSDLKSPHVYGLPPGVDFPAAFVQGLIKHTSKHPPEYLSTIKILVNSRRMQRRIREIFDAGPARLLPRLQLITDLGNNTLTDLPPATPKLQRQLELSQLVSALLQADPALAPRSAVFDLADSLANLMSEMQSEGVAPEALSNLDVSNHSGHWKRSLKFIELIQNYFGDEARKQPDTESRQRLVVEHLTKKWAETSPNHPIIIAGSTGSRGATHMLMAAVARLPQGAVILPGYDFDLRDPVWSAMDDAMTAADHPQFRFRALQKTLKIAPGGVEKWTSEIPNSTARNKLISLALRPAPITDQWMSEGEKLTDIDAAVEKMALVQAPSLRIEAMAIALKLRECAEIGKTAALITPNRMLTRQVTAALDQWGIEPDDSAGLPLPMSAPGRLLLQISGLFGQVLTSESLLALLKHPLTHSGDCGRGDHLRWTRDLELSIRKNGPAFPTKDSLNKWATKNTDDGRREWMKWLGDLLTGLEQIGTRSLTEHLEHHIFLANSLGAGPDAAGSGEIWEKPAGHKALEQVEMLKACAGFGGVLSAFDYVNLFRGVLNQTEVHDPTRPHPGIMIWGTLEARVQGADLVILGGLNDGIWPSAPSPDPWMNRQMRQDVGLLLPERQIGLSAHDFQQAIAAKEVWLTRSVRDSEAQTVPSRWLNRMENLLSGLTKTGGKKAYNEMKARGDQLLAMVETLERVTQSVDPANRPSPIPPPAAQPKSLSVTGITKLIRDPYAVYASKVLHLYPLNPLRQNPDAALAGTVIHRIMERFIKERGDETLAKAKDRLLLIADEVLESDAPWPAARCFWRAKLERVADWFLEGEERRRNLAEPVFLEGSGAAKVGNLDFTLTAKADRLDRSSDGLTYIYDYKTGPPPTEKQQLQFDKQLLLTAAMVERAGFKGLADTRVEAASFIGLGTNPKVVPAPLDKADINQIWAELETLLTEYLAGKKGYTSRSAMEKMQYSYGYEHLARHGEWDETKAPTEVKLK